jgi:hypothetical protein
MDPQDARYARPIMTPQLRAAAWRWFQMALGWLLILVGGPIGGILPGPVGVIFVIGGLILILRNSIWARRRFIQLSQRYPVVIGKLRGLLRRRKS